MWLLKSDKGTLYHIAARKEHTVGRKNGSLTLSDDQSISRLHAKFFLVSDSPNSDAGIKLIDLGSRYGTYINEGIGENKKIAANESRVLKHSDTVRFGLQWHTYTVIYMPLLVVVSSLSEEKTAIVENALSELNGEFSRAWNPNCTHFVMSAIMVSVKTVCALASGKHIVTPEFFQILRDAVSSGSSELPNPKDFIPESAETVLNSSVVSFAPNPRRSTLFDSLTFVATTSRQMSRLKSMITSAGGRAVLFSECNLSKKDMCNRNVLLMQNSPSSSDSQMSLIPDNYHNFAKYLSSQGYRCIPESDIGMSMVYCSIEKFCNPLHDPKTSLIVQQKVVDKPSQSQVIVPETQNESTQDEGPSGDSAVINETIPSPTTPRSSKRLRSSTDDEGEGEALKMKCGENQSKVISTSKNLRNDTRKHKEGVGDIIMKESVDGPNRPKDNGASVSASKGPALRNHTLKDMFASKSKSLNKVEEPQITKQKSPVTTGKSTIASKSCLEKGEESNKKSPVSDEDVSYIEESEDIVIEESESFSFDDYAKKHDEKKKPAVRTSVDVFDCSTTSKDGEKKKPTALTSVDMFDCSSTSKDGGKKKPTALTSVDMFDCSSTSKDDHNFLQPDVPKSVGKKTDDGCVKPASNNKNVASSSKSIDIFSSSTASTSASKSTLLSYSVSKKMNVKENSDKDFDFSDEDEPNENKSDRSSSKSADMFSTTTTETTITDKPDESDDFDFPDANQTKTSNLNRTRNSNSNPFGSSFTTRKTKRNQKQDEFDFPDEAPSQPKRTRQSSIFSESLFSDPKKVTVKTERADSVDDENSDFDFGNRNKRNAPNGGKICLSTFIDRQKNPGNTREGDQLENISIKDEPVDSDSDNSGNDEHASSTYSATVEIKPMIAKLNDLNINKHTSKDENSNDVNYKRFKKNKVAGCKQLPTIIKVSFIDTEDQKDTEWKSEISESEQESDDDDDDFDFGEMKKNDRNVKRKMRR